MSEYRKPRIAGEYAGRAGLYGSAIKTYTDANRSSSIIQLAVWDLDGVAYEGRATTYLSGGSKMPPAYFLKRFRDECGKPGPLSDISPTVLFERLFEWEIDHDTRIDTMKKLGTALTDLRHEYGLFTSKHTKYTKNAILEGVSMADVNRIMEDVPLNEGFEEAVTRLHEAEMLQAVFSNANYPVAVFFRERYGMAHGEGIPVLVRRGPSGVLHAPDVYGNHDFLYTPGMHGDPGVVFSGRITEKGWDKLGPFRRYVERSGVQLKRTAAIDDGHIELLRAVQEGGGLAVGYKVDEAERDGFRKMSVPVLKGDDLRGFAEIVLDRGKVAEYCE
jgi:hypothetical protein